MGSDIYIDQANENLLTAYVCVHLCVLKHLRTHLPPPKNIHKKAGEIAYFQTCTQGQIYKHVHKSHPRHSRLFYALPLTGQFACKPCCNDQFIWATVYVRYFHKPAIYVRRRQSMTYLKPPIETKQSEASETKWWKHKQKLVSVCVELPILIKSLSWMQIGKLGKDF